MPVNYLEQRGWRFGYENEKFNPNWRQRDVMGQKIDDSFFADVSFEVS